MNSPSSSKSVITVFGKCRCCLGYGYMQNMWSEYERNGMREIYGEMLMETFSISWQSPDETQDYICEPCVVRLQDAFDFKKEVLASELMFDDTEEINEDVSLFKVEMLDYYNEFEDHKQELVQEDDLDMDKAIASGTEYDEVEYLEDEIESKEALYPIKPESETEFNEKKRVRKWPKKKRKGELKRGYYKQYSDEDLKLSIEAVKNNSMSASEASKLYGVPRKTILGRLHYEQKKKTVPETSKEIENADDTEKHQNFVAEIKTVLSFTNAVPFKVRLGKYYCTYCDGERFDDPDELRIHCTSHEDVWLKNVDDILYPQNEILRMDIDNLQCKICDIHIKTWNDMFLHFKDKHEIELDQAYRRLVPFKLRRETLLCALCDKKFGNLPYLDAHMNTHYCNYMCSECGDTFLTEMRLRSHSQTHSTVRYPCEDCSKMFTVEKYLKKHQAMVHKKFKLFKCLYCPERFHQEFERHTHVVEKHNEKIRLTTCEICGMSFDWRPYYLKHVRKFHNNDNKHRCSYCPKVFASGHEWKLHEQRHTGSGKHVCTQCGKNYVTMAELRLHLKKHFKEGGFIP